MLSDAEIECCFAQYAYELYRVGQDGVDAASAPIADLTAPGLASATLDRDSAGLVLGPAQGSDWYHPNLDIG